MDIKKAVQHIEFRLTKTMKPTKTDIEAYNSIVDFVEKKNKQQFNNNQLFGKIFITFYGELLKFYKTSVFDSVPQKAINKILSEPIELIIKKFLNKANEQELYLRMKEANILDKHPLLKTKQEKEAERGNFKMDMLEPVMTIEEATENLTLMINNALDKYNVVQR